MNRCFLLPLFIMMINMVGFGQIKIRDLEQQIFDIEFDRKIRIKSFLAENPQIKEELFGGDKIYQISDVVNGHPIYMETHNAGVAISIGVDEVRSSGSLGLNLTGKGMRVGVWDQRVPRQSHIEFASRLIVNEAGEVSDHATHTLGTIIASGINNNARGMAYEATGVSYDWIDDSSEMLTEASVQGLLVSNHSYGPLAGWEPSLGQWFGDASVSSEEDYKFGYYDTRAKSWDGIVVNHPFYTIVKSAGNDRTDSGNGTFPPDGSFDIIASYGTAKNIITVGAVQKTTNGVSMPSDIVMSAFSSWGPTDDGRIKPDIVAPGVGVFSTTSANDMAYSSFNGTSMAAPAVSGSCILLQQLHNQLNGEFMWSSSLKGLIIHTAFEAGPAPGPDYQFGWGMINVARAAEFLVKKDDINKILVQGEIRDGETLNFELNPVAGKKITATLAWTDQPGTVPPVSLDPPNLMLVNDLDMRIVNEASNAILPWVLEPSTPGIAAKRGNNFRDNIEKIEFDNPEQRKYLVEITHKNSIVGGRQSFSLIISYESENSGLTNLYWIGGSGEWENAANWSLSSGGVGANVTPDASHKVIFDENSFSGSDGYTVSLNENATVGSIIWLAPETVTFELNNYVLTTSNSSQLSQENLFLKDGTFNLQLNDDMDKNFSLDRSNIDNIEIRVDNESTSVWNISPSINELDSLTITQGRARIVSDDTLKIMSIVVRNQGSVLDIGNNIVSGLNHLSSENGGQLIADNTEFIFNTETMIFIHLNTNVNSTFSLINSDGILSVNNNVAIHELKLLNSSILLEASISTDNLILNESTLNISDNSILEITNDIDLKASQLGKTIINAQTKGFINIIPHRKFCFENIMVTNVDLAGSASVSLGENSDVTNSENWFVGKCANLIFSNFEILYPCAKGITYLIDRSEGDYSNINWTVDGIVEGNSPTLFLEFNQPGEKEITLSVNNGEVTSQYTQIINVKPSNLDSNFIISNSTQLASFRTAASYQWFKDGNLLLGETSRVYLHNNSPGTYFVLTFNGECNRKSSLTTLVSTSDEEIEGIGIFPNPVNDGQLYIKSKDLQISESNISILNQLGQRYEVSARLTQKGIYNLDVSFLPTGIYFLVIENAGMRNVYKFINI